MKKILSILLAAAFALTGCTTDALDNLTPSTSSGADGNDPMAVSLDSALDEMYALMAGIEGEANDAKTRGTIRRTIGEVATFKTAGGQTGAKTRTSETTKNLAYVVNFNEGGFAVLGARTTLPSVLCIADEGSFTAEEVASLQRETILAENAAMPEWKTYEQIHYSNPDNAGEEFDPADYAADLDEDDPKDPNNPSETAAQDTGDYMIASMDAPHFAKRTVMEYALARDEEVSSRAGVEKRIRRLELQTTAAVDEDYTGTVYNDWEDFAKLGPFVTTRWNQSFPFNLSCPPDPQNASYTSYTGCVATALSQIIAFNERPAPSRIDRSVTSSWSEIKDHYYNPSRAAVRTAAMTRIESDMAKIVRAIGRGVDMYYTYYTGSAASSVDAKRYLAKDKYNVNYGKVRRRIVYKLKHVELMMGRGLPMYISAAGDGGAHAWVLDGTISQRRTVDTYENGIVTASRTETRHMIHCNFGWGGVANGYYYSEMFDPGAGAVDTEEGVDLDYSGANGRRYKSQYQLIQYDI